MFKRIGAIGVAASIIAGIALTATPAQAAGEFGSLVTINPSGGTSATDGLKIEIAGGQMQVFRDGEEQFYQNSPTPDADTACDMFNYFTVAILWVPTPPPMEISAPRQSIIGCDYYQSEGGNVSQSAVAWASGTITSNLTAGDQDGTVTLTLVSNELEAGKTITLEVLYTYAYPNPYVDLQTTLTVPAGIPGFNGAKLYWNGDATLGGSDEGNQIEGALADGSEIVGVVAADGSAIEAFNQRPGQSMQAWAGFYQCAWQNNYVGDPDCPNSQAAWTFFGSDIAPGISTGTGLDNGWGVQAPTATTAGTSVNSWRAYFVSCLDSSLTALQCIDAAAAPKALANTGSQLGAISGTLGGAAALALVVGALVVFRRRSAA